MTPEWERDAWETERGLWWQNPPAEMSEEEYAEAIAEYFAPPDETPLPVYADSEIPF
jgi:hypothetical protein